VKELIIEKDNKKDVEEVKGESKLDIYMDEKFGMNSDKHP